MAILTSIPPTPKGQPLSLPTTPPSPPRTHHTLPSIADHAEAEQAYATDLVDLDFTFDSVLLKIAPSLLAADTSNIGFESFGAQPLKDVSTRAVAVRDKWAPLLPDRPRSVVVPVQHGESVAEEQGEGKKEGNEKDGGGGPHSTIFQPSAVLTLDVQTDEVHLHDETTTSRPSTPDKADESRSTTSPTTETLLKSPLRVSASPFQLRTMQSVRTPPPASYSDTVESVSSHSLSPESTSIENLSSDKGDAIPSHTSPSSADTYQARERVANVDYDWTMQKGYGGFGKVPQPMSPIVSPTSKYHALPLSRPVRISSPPKKTVTLSPSIARTVPLPASVDSIRVVKHQDKEANPSEATSPARPESPLSKLARSFSGFSLKFDESLEPEATPLSGPPSDDHHGPVTHGHLDDSTLDGVNDRAALKPSGIDLVLPEPENDHVSHIPIPEGATEIEPSSLQSGFNEIKEVEEKWEAYRDAHGDFSAGFEEFIARMSAEFSRHICNTSDAPPDIIAELRLSRQQVTELQRQISLLEQARDAATTRADEAERTHSALTATTATLRREADQAMAALKEVKLREEVWRSKLEKAREGRDVLLEEQRYWHAREQMLSKSFIELEDEYQAVVDALHDERKGKLGDYRAQEKGVPPKGLAVALVEVTAHLIDAELIKKRYDGGVILAQSLTDAVLDSDVKHTAKSKSSKVLINLYLNFPDLRKELQKDKTITREAELHEFLDGFRSFNSFCCVHDGINPGSQLADHVDLYREIGADRIVIGTRSGHKLQRGLEQHKANRDIVRAIRTHQTREECWSWLGDAGMVTVKGISPAAIETPTPKASRIETSHHASEARPRSTSVISESQSAASSTFRTDTYQPNQENPRGDAAPLRKPNRNETVIPASTSSVSSYDEYVTPVPQRASMRRSDAMLAPTPASQTIDAKPPPWANAPSSTVKKAAWKSDFSPPAREEASSPIPYWQKGGTLLDQHLEVKSRTSATSGALHNTVSPPETPRPRSRSGTTSTRHTETDPSLTPKKADTRRYDDRDHERSRSETRETRETRGPQLTFRVDHHEIGGSPPSSDEDEPSVPLPHSAVKHVQRPTAFTTASASGSSDAGSSSHDTYQGEREERLEGWSRRADHPSVSEPFNRDGGGGGDGFGSRGGRGGGGGGGMGMSIRGRGRGGGGGGGNGRGESVTNANATPLGKGSLSERVNVAGFRVRK